MLYRARYIFLPERSIGQLYLNVKKYKNKINRPYYRSYPSVLYTTIIIIIIIIGKGKR